MVMGNYHLMPFDLTHISLFIALLLLLYCIIIRLMYDHGKFPFVHLLRTILFFFLRCLSMTVVRFQGVDMKSSNALLVQNLLLHFSKSIRPINNKKNHYTHVGIPSHYQIIKHWTYRKFMAHQHPQFRPFSCLQVNKTQLYFHNA